MIIRWCKLRKNWREISAKFSKYCVLANQPNIIREIPNSSSKIHCNIVYSLSEHFNSYNAQPQSKVEWHFMDRCDREAFVFEQFELEYWEGVNSEIEYLIACEQFYDT